MTELTENEFIQELQSFITKKYGTAARAAVAWECSRQLVFLVLKKKRKPSFIMEQDMRYERIEKVSYRRIK